MDVVAGKCVVVYDVVAGGEGEHEEGLVVVEVGAEDVPGGTPTMTMTKTKTRSTRMIIRKMTTMTVMASCIPETPSLAARILTTRRTSVAHSLLDGALLLLDAGPRWTNGWILCHQKKVMHGTLSSLKPCPGEKGSCTMTFLLL
jgi:hypothetical protein